MSLDIELYRKLANTYDVESSEQNAINDFVRQSNKIYSNTLSMYEILAPSLRGDDAVITKPDGTTKSTRAVFNYNKLEQTDTAMKKMQEKCFLELGDGVCGSYIEKVSTGEIFIIDSTDKNRFDYDDVILKRCNNVFKFIDKNGLLQTWNIHLEDTINETYPEYKKPTALPSGTIFAYVQYNEITKEIVENRRFLIGNRGVYQAYTVHGLNNFISESLARITLYVDQIDTVRDDLVNGIANVNDSIYTLELDSDDFQQEIGYTHQLDYVLKYNGEITTGDVLWTTSDEEIGIIDSYGNIELIALGEVTFTCTMSNNNSVSDSVVIDVVAVPSGIIEIRFEPNKTSISSSENPVIYTVTKYIDNVSQLDTFTFIDSGATDGKYNFNVLGGNTFSVESLGFDYIPLTVTATSDVDASSDTIDIQLKNEF